MKSFIVLLAMVLSVQSYAFESTSSKDKDLQATVAEKEKKFDISSSSASLYTDVECDMSDYTCSKIIMDLGRQEALAQIVSGNFLDRSEILNQAIKAFRMQNPDSQAISDEDVIYLLATSK